MVGSIFPEELAYQNVNCFCNIVKAVKKNKVKKILLCSTDKSSTPTSVMGASKLLLEKIACFSSDEFSKFSSVRFGNILNSSGSIIPRVISKLKSRERIDINHMDMTRYFLTENDFLNLVNYAINNMCGREIFIPKVRSLKIYDLVTVLVDLFCNKYGISSKKITVRVLDNPYKENIDERLINPDEVNFLKESGKYFILRPLEQAEITREKDGSYLNLLNSAKDKLSKQEVIDLMKELEVI
jgi:FlaA1/EpsC-like NDP-sugar epimerase